MDSNTHTHDKIADLIDLHGAKGKAAAFVYYAAIGHAQGHVDEDNPTQNGLIRRSSLKPHLVYVMHITAQGLYKVGLTRHDSRRLHDMTARGRAELIVSVRLPNRWAARLVEIAVLDATDTARSFGEIAGGQHGKTECWADSTPIPDLEAIAATLSRDPGLTFWETSTGQTPLEGTEEWLST